MTARLDRLSWPLLAFAAFATGAYLVSALVVVPALAAVSRPDVLAAALAVDLAVLVPLAWAGVVRAHGWRWATVGPVVALSALGAWWVLPAAHRGVLAPLAVVVPALELGAGALVVASLVRVLRRSREGDAFDQIRAAAARVLGETAASRALAYELAVFRYALGPTAGPTAMPAEPGAFPYRRSSGYGTLLVGVAVAGALELVGGHVLVRHLWGDGAALVHLLVSGYALVWLVGDWRALGARPIRLRAGVLEVRCGLRWSVDLPVADVETVYHVRRALPTDRPTLDASVLRSPAFALDLARPVEAEGPYGLRRRVERVALGVDEPERFLEALSAAMRAAGRTG